jgi:hypothetical protein
MTISGIAKRASRVPTAVKFHGLPVAAAVDATLRWVNGDANASVFQYVDMVLGPLDLPLVSRYKTTEAERQQVRGWLETVGRIVARNRLRSDHGHGLSARLPIPLREELRSELLALTGAFSLQPKLTTRGIEYVVEAGAFVHSSPLKWAALATAEIATTPDAFHFLLCPGCERFSVDIRKGKGKRRGRFCSKRCQDRVGQRERRAVQPKRKLRTLKRKRVKAR